MRLSRILIYFLSGILISQSVYYYPILPENMASHFDGAGNPNGWMSKSFFFIFEGFLLLLILAEFTLLPLLIEKMPKSLLNMPNKDFWMADERKTETFFAIRIFFEWLSIALLALFIAVNQLVFQANITKTNLPSTPMWTILGLFFLFVIVWIVKFILRFRMPK